MKQIFTLLIALCWLLPSAHADVRRTEAKDSLLRIYLASPADTTRLETLYQIALLDQLSQITGRGHRPEKYTLPECGHICTHYLLLQPTGPKTCRTMAEEARTVV